MDLSDYPAVEVRERDDPDRPYAVVTGHTADDPIPCETREQAADLAAVAVVTNFREERTGRRGIPPNVAKAGMPEIVTYMLAHPDSGVHSAEWFSRAYDLDRDTVYAYVSRVRSQAEDRVADAATV